MVEEVAGLELLLSPQHRTLDDERFAGHARELVTALRDDVGSVTEHTVPVPGKRGGTPEIILALGTSGAITAAVAALRFWLDRDKARKISIKVRSKGTARDIEITADAASIHELETLLSAARRD